MEKIYTYPSCISVHGYSRSIIQDLYRSKYVFVPKWLASVLENDNSITINEFKKILLRYNEESQLEYYLNFLIENEIIYITNKDKDVEFQAIPLVFDMPSTITNSILLFKEINIKKLKKLILELENLGCENIQLYFPEFKDFAIISDILSLFDDSTIHYIELITNYNIIYINLDELAELFSNNNRLFRLHIADASEDKKIFVDSFQIKYIIFSIEEFSFAQCGEIHPLFFKNDISFFTESQSYNTCLNRKLCIDSEGIIRNCPAINNSYGNIKDTSLQKAVDKIEFRNLWNINKEKIDICKHCEFRHMCTDCRAFIKFPDNIYSQPIKCGYNPYICKWKGEEGFIPIEECGEFTKGLEFVPNQEKISSINTKLWGE